MYCGIAKDVEKRLVQHLSGKGSKYVRSRLPARLEMFVRGFTRSEALKVEALVKRQPKKEKVSCLDMFNKKPPEKT